MAFPDKTLKNLDKAELSAIINIQKYQLHLQIAAYLQDQFGEKTMPKKSPL